ncbi:hypothetical protein QEH52_19295 [Coraliomargarita sp. SDUM461003]|uniref:Barstar (barnase inhibitor) domain-containing protein n=1 Tax=Thalassobacterium maritimum TaxID=3041265 RepID=A0ABU1AZW6_9BACT|nr:hypothetical protein [Coraliomargarita sp. SDUM461003]MDQ8209673.1 hypothetical protein [Coraliomargarita sp. SDUM461003]
MSNEIYGFVDVSLSSSGSESLFKKLENTYGVGVCKIGEEQLYNFPQYLLDQSSGKLLFCIADKPGGWNATCLIDYLNYATNASIGLPLNGVDRVRLLEQVLADLLLESNASRLCVALTDSSLIDESKIVLLESFHEILSNDFAECAPPCVLYDLRVK